MDRMVCVTGDVT